jgi:hypothetical protein
MSMRPAREFTCVAMKDVPDPVNARTRRSAIWPLFEAICALPNDETKAIKVATRDAGDANQMMNKLKAWGREYAPEKRFVNNRSADRKEIYIWWTTEATDE